ncbi:RNA polymerase sigma factor [Streptomyces altiplanensis]
MRARIRAGDPQAFAELFDHYAKTIYNHTYRLTADWSAAEDIVSATFMEAWRGRQRLEAEGGSVRPWLLGIATNLVRAQSRGNRRYKAAATASALAGLRRTEREVLSLCLWQGMDYAAAAQVLKIPVGTVRSRLSRAHKKLRKLAEAQLPGTFREPRPVNRQIREDRTIAARPAQEGNR